MSADGYIKLWRKVFDSTINSTNKYSIISIVNWAQYQEELTNKPQANDKLVSTNKNSKNSNKDNTIQFDVFWSAYPKKVGKKDTVKAFTKLNPTQELLETILTKLEVLKKSDSWTRGYIPNPATFLNGERWNDEPVKTMAQGKPKQQIGADGWPLGLCRPANKCVDIIRDDVKQEFLCLIGSGKF